MEQQLHDIISTLAEAIQQAARRDTQAVMNTLENLQELLHPTPMPKQPVRLDARGLRIGNILMDRDTGKRAEVHVIEADGPICDNITLGGEAIGLPLTPELLNGFGFKRMLYTSSAYSIAAGDWNFISDTSETIVQWGPLPNRIVIPGIHFAHQLQNLFHAIIGEELCYSV